MGILDKKTRFIDLVITQEGKRQIASGKLRAELASLSDGNSFYDEFENDDVSDRIYFEVMERPENAITLEKDDSGVLLPFNFSPTGSIVGNNIFSTALNTSNTLETLIVTGSQFASSEASIMNAMLNHFKHNYLLGTNDAIGSNEFLIDPKEITYIIDDTSPFGSRPRDNVINVNDAEPFFLDPRLAHLPNYQFLPPINKDGTEFGSYQDLRSTNEETYEEIKERLGYKEDEESVSIETLDEDDYFGSLGNTSRKLLLDNGELPEKPSRVALFESFQIKKTSSENNLVIQLFEDSTGNTMTKLDIIDAGVYYDDSSTIRNEKRIFYAGKIFFDSFQTPTFVNIFTLLME